MTLTKTEARIPARMPQEVYERIVAASETVGATLNQFLVQAALERANCVLEQERTIALSLEAAENLFDLIKNPPEPNEQLKKAMERHEALLCR
jgi:uncharacterized protein (DUF1778 family)